MVVANYQSTHDSPLNFGLHFGVKYDIIHIWTEV